MSRHKLPLILFLLAAGPATAQTQETGGIGGTGIGRSRQPILAYGPIQAFGSVFVNGREYAFGPRTLVTIDGAPASIAALRVGDIAQLRGITAAPRHGYAEAINVIHPLIGPVSAVSNQGRQALIMGQTVIAAGTPLFATVQPGEVVAVSAQRRADGSWVAGNVTPASPAVAQIAAPAQESAGGLRLAGVPVTLPPGMAAPAPGSAVLARGSFVDGVLHAERLTAAPLLDAPPGTRVEVQDYFHEASGGGSGRLVAPDGLAVETAAPAGRLTGMVPAALSGILVAPDLVELQGPDSDGMAQDPIRPEAPERGYEPPELPAVPDEDLIEAPDAVLEGTPADKD